MVKWSRPAKRDLREIHRYIALDSKLGIEDIKACVRYVVNLVAAEEVHLREVSS